MRNRANSALSDIIMSDPLSPETVPSEYSYAASNEEEHQLHSTELDEEDAPMTASEMDKSIASSPLFRLPRELRERIYAHCLSARYIIFWPTTHLSAGLQPQLLRTCSAILQEAAPLLYSTNTFQFHHPSDCNMFLWAHNPDLGRLVTTMILQARDKDVRSLWSPYLGSTSMSRSLYIDYPHLQTLHVELKSNFMSILQGSLEERFRRWDGDRQLRDMCMALDGRTPEGCDVRILVCTRMVGRDVQHLLKEFPEELGSSMAWRGNRDDSIIARTHWRPSFRPCIPVALQLEGLLSERVNGP
jgi:hypothetical protein